MVVVVKVVILMLMVVVKVMILVLAVVLNVVILPISRFQKSNRSNNNSGEAL